jgi:hypothetical protein
LIFKMALDDIVEDRGSKRLIRKAGRLLFKSALAVGTTLLSTSFVGTTGVFIASGLTIGSAMASLIKRKPFYDIVDDSLSLYSTINTIVSPIIWLGDATFPLVEKLVYQVAPNDILLARIAQGVYSLTAYNAVFTGMFSGAKHLVDNYLNPAGISDSIKDKFYNNYARNLLTFAPAYLSVSWGIPEWTILGYKLPAFAWNALFGGFYGTANPLPEKTEKQYFNPIPGLVSVGKNAVKGVYEAIYGIGSAITGAKQITPPAPATATATGGAPS